MGQTDAFIRLRAGTAASWTTANPILLSGEKGVESDTKKEKIGDGVTVWSSLGYQIGTPVPEGAVFTDTITAVLNILTSTSTTDALSAAQGKVLKDLIDTLAIADIIDLQTALDAKADDSDIGTTIQAYDADTTKNDIDNTFSAAQRTSTSAGDNSIAFNDNNNHTLTATAANITVTNQTIGQGGTITITTAENITGWGTEFTWGNTGAPTGLTGVEYFEYKIIGASGANSILIGRI